MKRPDSVGAFASGLCALHCMVTPFIFIAAAHSSVVHAEKPIWWQLIDYVFILISFFAIRQAVKQSSKSWMKTAMWSVWLVLTAGVINETFEIQHLPESVVYVPALVLLGLHLYNQKYCKCEDETCCAPSGI